jgi:hypothetical protein
MKFSRLLLIVFLACVAVSWFPKTAFWKKNLPLHGPNQKAKHPYNIKWLIKMEERAAKAKEFVKQKGYNTNLCFFIDMSLHSGKNRFFIYDLKMDSVKNSGLVAHGNCFEYWQKGRRYSNEVGSGCTSVGKYKIGNAYTGKWGYSFKLHGLNNTNNNAFERTVVLHGHSCVPDSEVKDEICQSNGCPTVSPVFLQQLKAIINSSKKPVLLWIYE